MEKIVLVDGHSILNRAFFGVPDLTNSEGLHTNAIYGFLNILFKILDEETPDYLTVAFDLSAPTFRHKMYSAYKGTRKPMADELRQQVPVIKEVLNAMGIMCVSMEGYEADDILGTVAGMAERKGIDVSLVSGDRDLLQIATEKIKIRIPKTKGGKTEIEDYYPKDVVEAFGVDPKGFIELKALMGDTADNIPGVPKVGQKTAAELMATYGSLEGIYANVDSITKNAVRESIKENKDLAYLSLELATIKTDVPIDFDFENARVHNFYTDEAYKYFKRLEFKNMLSRFETKISYDDIVSTFRVIDDITESDTYVRTIIKEEKNIGLYPVEENGNLLGIAISTEKEVVFIRKWFLLTEDYLAGYIKELAESGLHISFADTKSAYKYFNVLNVATSDAGKTNTGKFDTDRFDDIIIGAYLNNPLKNDYSVTDIANEYLGMLIPDRAQLFKKESLESAMDSHPDEFKEYACYRAYICRVALAHIMDKLSKNGMTKLYKSIEMPLTYVLYSMEQSGIKVVPAKLKEYSDMLGDNIAEIEKKIYDAAGCEFNINSPKQLGEILFEKLQLPGGKKTKTGYSTAADVLEKLSEDYPMVKDILSYRAYTKLKSTYADGLTQYIDETGRIHSTFNQTITATGRLSSTEPNLQNIPIRMELGRQIRKVFVPKDGYVFMDADYSQIELRVLASLAGDERLIKAYSEHADIHRITASQVFHVPFEEVTDLQRRNAKAVNFGIVYGISAFGLGEDLGISAKEAKKYIEDYFLTYPKIKEYLDSTVSGAKEKGYITTYYGRRRPIPELSSSNFMQRSFGERVAMNSPIQGTAADIIKIAMIRVFERLSKENLESKLILQVHDELLIETKLEEKDRVEAILREEMINATDLAVKMEIDLHTGNDWFEAK